MSTPKTVHYYMSLHPVFPLPSLPLSIFSHFSVKCFSLKVCVGAWLNLIASVLSRFSLSTSAPALHKLGCLRSCTQKSRLHSAGQHCISSYNDIFLISHVSKIALCDCEQHISNAHRINTMQQYFPYYSFYICRFNENNKNSCALPPTSPVQAVQVTWRW